MRCERLILRLRIRQGVELTADELRVLQVSVRFQGMLDEKLMQLEQRQLSLAPAGFLLADAIAVELVQGIETRLYAVYGIHRRPFVLC